MTMPTDFTRAQIAAIKLARLQDECKLEMQALAVEYAARMLPEDMLTQRTPGARQELFTRAGALMAYALVKMCEEYGSSDPRRVRAAVLGALNTYAPEITCDGGTS